MLNAIITTVNTAIVRLSTDMILPFEQRNHTGRCDPMMFNIVNNFDYFNAIIGIWHTMAATNTPRSLRDK